MAMRFNPPPGWPPAPPSWVPPANWKPNESWPPAPDGWPLWVDDGEAPPPLVRPVPLVAASGVAQSPMRIRGRGGQVEFDGRSVTIYRRGLLARATLGKGEKSLPIRAISGVQWKPAGPLVNGFIQFTIPGGNEVRGHFGTQTWNAIDDQHSVVFTRRQQAKFERLRTAVLNAIAAP